MYFRGALSAVFALFLAGGISVARADVAVIEELSQTAFQNYFGSTTGTFDGHATQGTFNSESSLQLGSVSYSDTDGSLALVGSDTSTLADPPSPATFDIGTGNPLLVDDDGTGNANINMTFATPVYAVGLIAGDAYGGSVTTPPPFNDIATFGVTSGGGTSTPSITTGVVDGVHDSPLIMAGNTPTYFGIFDISGSGIGQVNFSDSALFPTLDTVVTAAPEPTFVWLLAMAMLAMFGIHAIIGKKKNVAARLVSGAAPLALLAVVALLAVPSRSFAQMNCLLAVPNNPLTAAGLATPYLLSSPTGSSGCSQANTTGGTLAFVQAAVYSKSAHTISVYTPLVADAPTSTPGVPRTPRYAISPVVPTLPADAVVAIWFGYNANNLTLTGTAVTNGTCFTGFGQFAACNATNFWNAVLGDDQISIPPRQTSPNDHLPCPSPRSYSIVDQDPTDNLPVSFLLTSDNRVAQNTPANMAKLNSLKLNPKVQINPSDEAVVDIFVDAALGCNPPLVTDLIDPTNSTKSPSLAFNELVANAYGDPALVPIGDTFTLTTPFTQPPSPNPTFMDATHPFTNVSGGVQGLDMYNAYVANWNLARTNQYRAAVGQPSADSIATGSSDGSSGDASVATFCNRMFKRNGTDNSPADLLFNEDWSYLDQATNGPGLGNLFIFLGNRFAATYDLLGCAAVFGEPNPVNVTNVAATSPTTPGTPAPQSGYYYYPAVFP